jgi:hypothetical protein
MRKVLVALTFLMALCMGVAPALAEHPDDEQPPESPGTPEPEEPGTPPTTAPGANYPPGSNNIVINVNNNTVVGGQIIIVAGNNAPPGGTVTISIGGNNATIGDVHIASVNSAGAFQAKFAVPKNLAPGPALVRATASNGETTSAALLVEAPPGEAGTVVSPEQTAAGSGPGSGSGSDPGQLPFTGGRTLPSLAGGVGLILAGGALLLTARRRRAASRTD